MPTVDILSRFNVHVKGSKACIRAKWRYTNNNKGLEVDRRPRFCALQVAIQGQSGQYCRDLTGKRGDSMELEQVYKIGQVAKALRVTDKTVYRMLSDGRLQGVKLGNRWRIRAVDLEGFLKRHTVKR